MELVPKKVLYAKIPFFPFVFFSIKVGTMWGKQMLHFNCCTWSQWENPYCLKKKSPWNRLAIITNPKFGL
jgi:hypothetical protein